MVLTHGVACLWKLHCAIFFSLFFQELQFSTCNAPDNGQDGYSPSDCWQHYKASFCIIFDDMRDILTRSEKFNLIIQKQSNSGFMLLIRGQVSKLRKKRSCKGCGSNRSNGSNELSVA